MDKATIRACIRSTIIDSLGADEAAVVIDELNDNDEEMGKLTNEALASIEGAYAASPNGAPIIVEEIGLKAFLGNLAQRYAPAKG